MSNIKQALEEMTIDGDLQSIYEESYDIMIGNELIDTVVSNIQETENKEAKDKTKKNLFCAIALVEDLIAKHEIAILWLQKVLKDMQDVNKEII